MSANRAPSARSTAGPVCNESLFLTRVSADESDLVGPACPGRRADIWNRATG